MITINLIKKRAVSIEEIKKYSSLFWGVLGVLSIVLIILIISSIMILNRVNNLETSYQEKSQQIKKQQQEYETELKFLQEFLPRIDLSKKILTEKRNFSYLLKYIGDNLPKNIYVNDFVIQEKNMNISIYIFPQKGDEFEIVRNFISILEDTGMFVKENTKITSGERTNLSGKEVLNFQVSLRMR